MRNQLKKTIFLLSLTIISVFGAKAQTPFDYNPDIIENEWRAKWISHPDIQGEEFGVYLFRKDFSLSSLPSDFVVHLSADNRYKFYVNGEYVCNGPARGDEFNWRFESVDIIDKLRVGKNQLSVEVWNFSNLKPGAQHSVKTGLIMQGDGDEEHMINTDDTWKVHNDKAYSPIRVNINSYYVVGPGENFEAIHHPWNWKTNPINTNWQSADEGERGRPLKSLGIYGGKPSRILVPRPIPFMEEFTQRFKSVRSFEVEQGNGIENVEFINGNKPLLIPANSKVKILVDHGVLTNAYPVFKFSGGSKSNITVTYAESLRDANNFKNNRNEVEGKLMVGNTDVIKPDGDSSEHEFTTLWWRTFRYIQLEIQTDDEALKITDFFSVFTGYPLEEKAHFKTDIDLHDDIWNVGWRTQRLCAGENFFDCPYYEQLQYAGDTRIQCLVSRYVSGDTLLMRNALTSYYDSYLALGLTRSRYPSNDLQVIPPFSLIWITMLYDYWMLCDEPELIESMLPTAQNILKWFENRIDDSGLVGHLEWWNFVDWVNFDGWKSGVPPGVPDHPSSVINLQYVYTMQKAEKMFEHFGFDQLVSKNKKIQAGILEKVKSTCYSTDRMLLADNEQKNTFSQHASVMSVLSGLTTGDEALELLDRISKEENIAQCSYYYNFYFIEALQKIENGNQFLKMLGPWETMLDMGLTTFAEKPEPSRSDCHAWSASPLYYDLSLVCGIQPLTNGFKKVLIKPNLGDLSHVSGSIPHRKGTISVDFKKSSSNKISGYIDLPKDLDGEFHLDGKIYEIHGGRRFTF